MRERVGTDLEFLGRCKETFKRGASGAAACVSKCPFHQSVGHQEHGSESVGPFLKLYGSPWARDKCELCPSSAVVQEVAEFVSQ